MKNRISITIAWLQLLLLLFALFPKEIVHELNGCNDTTDCISIPGKAHAILSEQHHHCELLQLDAPHIFIAGETFYFTGLCCSAAVFFTLQENRLAPVSYFSSSRAPPLTDLLTA